MLLLVLAAAAALFVGVAASGTPVVAHGGVVSVADDDNSGDGGSDDSDPDSGGSGKGSDNGSGNGSDDRGDGGQDGARDGDEEFPGRDQIGRASADEYVDLPRIRPLGTIGEGGVFSGGSYTVRCALSSHKNSDNPIIAPGVRNGAQHTHDYAGNEGTNFASEERTLEEASTTCTNGDRSPIFWPVLRDLRGQGPDVGVDGGSLDGNVGSFVEPTSVDFTFHGHGTRRTEAMPLNMVLVTGSAKAGTTGGEGANAKYTCSGSGGRVTDLYPVCPDGSALQRMYDFPSCWNGQDLDSEDHITHIAFPDDDGECAEDLIPVPALRITVTYDDVPPGRLFAIDSFPEQQHDPVTDHALLEYLSSERRAGEGVTCINAARRCVQGPEQDGAAAGSAEPVDQVPRSLSFARALATHGYVHRSHPATATPRPGPRHGTETPVPAQTTVTARGDHATAEVPARAPSLAAPATATHLAARRAQPRAVLPPPPVGPLPGLAPPSPPAAPIVPVPTGARVGAGI